MELFASIFYNLSVVIEIGQNWIFMFFVDVGGAFKFMWNMTLQGIFVGRFDHEKGQNNHQIKFLAISSIHLRCDNYTGYINISEVLSGVHAYRRFSQIYINHGPWGLYFDASKGPMDQIFIPGHIWVTTGPIFTSRNPHKLKVLTLFQCIPEGISLWHFMAAIANNVCASDDKFYTAFTKYAAGYLETCKDLPGSSLVS